ncbi:sulfurtransferase [Furfurilactobacillus sp. OKN36]
MLVAMSIAEWIFDIVGLTIVVGWVIWRIVMVVRRNRAATMLDQEEFQAGMRRAQIIDVREKKDFDAGHILGARNIPYSTFSQRFKEIREDLPVYLYDESRTLSGRAALRLANNGYTKLFILKGGYGRWEGKTKSSKY